LNSDKKFIRKQDIILCTVANGGKKMKRKIFIYILCFAIIIFSTLPAHGVNNFEAMDGFGIISAGDNSSFAIQSDGSLWAWGNNRSGQLGDGTTIDRHAPVRIMDEVVAVSAESYYTMAIRTDGSLWGWGTNNFGELGDGTSEARHTPIKIMDDVLAVSTSRGRTMAIKTDNSLWRWGSPGGPREYFIPMKIMDDVAAVSISESTKMVIKTDGSLWVWGENYVGQIGDGTTENRYEPVWIMNDVIAIAADDTRSAAITSDGSLWIWGCNNFGQLGDGTTTNRHEPVKIMDDVVYVSVGAMHTAAVRTDGSLWIWGIYNEIPTEVMDNVAAVSLGEHIALGFGGGFHTLALRTDGSLWAWGTNAHGQIGNGSTYMQYEPAKIMDGVTLPSGVAPVEPLPPPQIPHGVFPSATTIILTIGSTTVTVNDEPSELSYAPFIGEGGRTMVPFRFIEDEMYAETGWNAATQTAFIYTNGDFINLVIGQPLPNGMGTPEIRNGRAFVPVRFIADAMGGTINWDAATQTVTIII
jgi:alpha-tubulin suppressor-like RCC1 family protein